MFIRFITTTAILLVCSAAHAQAVAPMAVAPSSNIFIDESNSFPVAEPRPDAQQPYASFQLSALEERPEDERRFSQSGAEMPKHPSLRMGREADQGHKETYISTRMEMEPPSVIRYYDQGPDVPPHVAPQIFEPEMQSSAGPDLQRSPPLGAVSYKELPAKADPFSPGYASTPPFDMLSSDDRRACSCIAINGRACPPSLHQAAFAIGPARV